MTCDRRRGKVDASGVAYDLDTAVVKFSPPVAGPFITSLGGSGMAITDGVTRSEIDGNGGVAREEPMPMSPGEGLGPS